MRFFNICAVRPNSSPSVTPDTSRLLDASERKSTDSARRSNWIPFHPILFAAYPILALYSHNMADVAIREIWRPMFVFTGATAMVWIISSLMFRSWSKGALITSVAATLFCSYGHISNLIPSRFEEHITPLSIALLTAVAISLFISRRDLSGINGAFNVAALAVTIPAVWTIGYTFLGKSLPSDSGSATVLADSSPWPIDAARIGSNGGAALPKNELPDIYYIILDAHGRTDSIKSFFGFDNSPFIEELKRRGFYLPSKSRSNYDQTGYSLSSSLNMDFLSSFPKLGSSPDLFESLRKMIDQSAVAGALRKRGYRYVSIWTGANLTRVDSCDVSLTDPDWTPPLSFNEQLMGLTFAGCTPESQGSKWASHRGFVRGALNSLATVATLPSPKFVFAHLEVPHPPFVFGPNGEAVEPPGHVTDVDGSILMQHLTKEQYGKGYTDQVKYIDSRILSAVDSILAKSKTRPIIIIQGDHGSRMNVNWESLAKTDLREPYPILNAYLVPQCVRERLYDTITPVNTFGAVLGGLFGINVPHHPDRSFYSPTTNPLAFVDVTSKVTDPPTAAVAVQMSGNSIKQ